MIYRTGMMVSVAVAILAHSTVRGANETVESTHDGKFVSLTGNKLEMTSYKGKEHTHLLAFEAKVTCDGNECKASDLKSGMKIRVTTLNGDKRVATHIEALDKNQMFANTHDGKFVSLMGAKLEMTDAKGKEHSRTIARDAAMTVDGMACKAEHLKVGMKIRVTTEKNDASVATRIDAIHLETEF